MKEIYNITEIIIGSTIEVHKVLRGPGLLESVFEKWNPPYCK